jgi:hypothetical protein
MVAIPIRSVIRTLLTGNCFQASQTKLLEREICQHVVAVTSQPAIGEPATCERLHKVQYIFRTKFYGVRRKSAKRLLGEIHLRTLKVTDSSKDNVAELKAIETE